MGTKLSQHKPKHTMVITITPGKIRTPPPPPSSSSSTLPTQIPEAVPLENSSDQFKADPVRSLNSDVLSLSRTSLMSGGSYSGFREKRRVSFDLLAEMSYVLPNREQPLPPILVEVGSKGEEEEEDLDMGDICNGSSDSDNEDSKKTGDGERRKKRTRNNDKNDDEAGLRVATNFKENKGPLERRDSPYDLALTDYEEEPVSAAGLTKASKMENLSREDLQGTVGEDKDAEEAEIQPDSELPGASVVRSIDVTIEIEKVAGQTLGFSIAGGRGSTPAYEDVDDSVYVTKIAPEGLAEIDGRMRLGDKMLSVNHISMVNATHAEAVAALKSVTSSCHLVISREVLVVLPKSITEENEEEEGEEPVITEDKIGAESPPVPILTPTEITSGGKGSGASVEAAEKIVSDAVEKSVARVKLEKEAEEMQEEQQEKDSPTPTPPPSGRQHDNYVNFDIAQIVVKESRREDKGAEPITKTPEDSPLHAIKKPEETEYSRRRSCPSVSMSLDDDEEDFPEERVVLDRSIGRLGLSIVGGADHVSRVFGQGRPGLYVSKISKGGAAEATGKLRLGDRILEVNKFNVRFSTHQQAVQWLISQEGDIDLLIQHVPQPPGLMEVVLRKEADQKLGLSIRGGGKGSQGNPLDPNDEGIFISKVSKDGAVEKDGHLKVGMRIVEVNGTSFLGASHSQAVKALRNFPDLRITVCDGFDPEEVIQMKAMADALEAERMSSITASSHIPLSAASSMILDSAIHGLLNESIDGLAMSPSRKAHTLKTKSSQSAVTPSYYSLKSSKLSQSSNALDEKPLTNVKDFDSLLEELAKFKIETSKQIETLDKMTQRHSTPDLEPIPLWDIIGPLQSGGIGVLDDNAFDPYLDDSFASELSRVELKDTSSMLADIDSEVSIMHEEVSKSEDEIERAQNEVEDENATPKVKRRTTQRLKVPSTPVNPNLASPETRRRAEQIKIDIAPPPDAKASEAAVKSIIGEVFSDISFEEFEQQTTWSNRSSGLLRSLSPDSDSGMDDLLSALAHIGKGGKDSERGQQSNSTKQSNQTSSSESMDGPEPEFGKVPLAKDRARTMPATITSDCTPSDTTSSSEVTLRVHATPSDPSKRKSAPAVAEKPQSSLLSPERLTFQEKLALHKKVAEDSTAAPVPNKAISISSTAIAKPVLAPPPVNRTSSDGKVPSSPTSPTEIPSSLTDRITTLRNNQARAGMAPVEVKRNVISDRRLSAEEKRLARVVKTDNKEMESSSAPDVTLSPLHNNKDHNPSQTIILSNTNSNNSKTSPSPVHLVCVSYSNVKAQGDHSQMAAERAAATTTTTDKPKRQPPKTLV